MRLLCRAEIGWRNPQIQIQLTPLSWGLAFGLSKGHIGILVGPLAIVIWYRWRSVFRSEFVHYSYPD